jgi:hypothetical protein
MGRKYNFRPDKSRSRLLRHLIPTPKQRKQVLKWGAYTLFLVLLSVVQDVLLARVRLFGATTELIPCAIFLICILEGPHNGSVFALIGAMGYLFSGSAPGTYALATITFLAVSATLLRQTFLQERFSSCMLCTAGAMVLYELSNFALGLLLKLTVFGRFYGFILTAVLTLAVSPLIYPLAKAIHRIGDQAWNE